MIKERETAIKILDLFEGLLEKHDLTLPSRDREGNEEEARIYGSAYYNLEDKITDILIKSGDKK